MLTSPGSVGILFIGLIAGLYFALFFDANPKLSATSLVSLLAVIGVGPTALVLINQYRQLDLLDPYGTGLIIGVIVNFFFRLGSYLLRTSPFRLSLSPRPPGTFKLETVEESQGKTERFVDALGKVLKDVSSSKSAGQQQGVLIRTEKGSYIYGKYEIRPASYEVRESPNKPAGWVPKAELLEWGTETLTIQPLTMHNRIVKSKDEADHLAVGMAMRWIDHHAS